MFLIIHPTLNTALWLRAAMISYKFGNPIISRSQFNQAVIFHDHYLVIIRKEERLLFLQDWVSVCGCILCNYQTY